MEEKSRELKYDKPHVDVYEANLCALDRETAKLCLGYDANMRLGFFWSQDYDEDPSTPDIKDGFYKLGFNIYSE